jgi:hypothetical protein
VADNPNPLEPGRGNDVRSSSNMSSFKSALEPIPALDAASSVFLQVEILKESYDEIARVVEANEWDMDAGLTTMLLSGLGLQKGLVHLDAVNGIIARGEAHASQRVDDIVQELAAYHSMYSVMKFKAFKLYKLNQVLEFNNSGLRAQDVMWQEWADRMRSERDDLNAELIRLRTLLSEFKLDWEESGAPPLPPGLFASLKVKEMESLPPAEEEADPPEEAAGPEPVEEKESLWARVRRLFTR